MAATTAVLVETSTFLWLVEISTGDVITNSETLLVDTSFDNVFMTQDLLSFQKVQVGSDRLVIHQREFHRINSGDY